MKKCQPNYEICNKKITKEEYMFAHEVVGKNFMGIQYGQRKRKRKHVLLFRCLVHIYESLFNRNNKLLHAATTSLRKEKDIMTFGVLCLLS